MSDRMLVAGAINTDLVARVRRAPEAGETVTGSSFDIFGGGKGANQALAAARSGATTAMLGALGVDDFGRQRLTDLQADGIDVESVRMSGEAASGVALIVVDELGENRISYVPGATLTVSERDAVAAFERVRPGVILATIELPNVALAALFRAARSAGSRVIVNATPEPASGAALLPHADVLIVNETETRELLGQPTGSDWVGASSRLRELGPSWVIITLGADGAVANFDGRIVRATAPRVEVVDTTGAGDAFCGAFAARLALGADPDDALRAGIAAGTLAVTVAGAQRSMPRQADVLRLSESVALNGA
ncbi:MAG: ribokinase [Thermomicrobiales bacterium]|nr:ribokinase [Thermomicrobiales bacterium]